MANNKRNKTIKVVTVRKSGRTNKHKQKKFIGPIQYEKKEKVMQVMRPLRKAQMTAMEKRFVIALRDPFDKRAIGCRIPSESRQTTQTCCFHGKVNVGQGTNAANPGLVMFLPNPFISTWCAGTSTTSGTFPTNELTYLQSTFTELSSNTALAGFSSPATFAASANTFRVVSFGVVIRSRYPTGINAADFTVFQMPVAGKFPPFNVLNSHAINATTGRDALFTQVLGVAKGQSGSYLGFQPLANEEAHAFTSFDVMEKAVKLVARPTGDAFKNWKNVSAASDSNELFSSGDVQGNWVDVNTGSTNYADTNDNVDMSGWPALCVLSNAAGNADAAIYSAEIIMHVEYTQNLSFVSGVNVMNNTPLETDRSTMSTEQLLDAAKTGLSYISVVKNGVDAIFGKRQGPVDSLARTVLGIEL